MHPRSPLRPLGALLALAAAFFVMPTSMPHAMAATIKPIVFPVEGKVTYTDTYGACRGTACERRHEGIDLMGSKMQRLLAAVDGTVLRVTYDNTSSGGNSLVIEGADGWTYHYIHMNNDRPGTDDGRASYDQVFAPGIAQGASVKRGQFVGYMGDSGNAEDTAPHNHFEIRQPGTGSSRGRGTPINPYDSLRAAVVWNAAPHWELFRLGSSSTPTAQIQLEMGTLPGDIGLLCDWDGDGYDEPTVFRNGRWFLRSSVTGTGTQATLNHGVAGDQPLCGNVDGVAGDEPIVFRSSRWYVRAGFGASDTHVYEVTYGTVPGDKPVLGDWDRDGDEDFGIWRQGRWFLRSSAAPSGSNIRQVTFGSEPGDIPIAGDWDRNGRVDLGIFRNGRWHLRSSSQPEGTVTTRFTFGAPGDHPVVGRWEGTPRGVGFMRPNS